MKSGDLILADKGFLIEYLLPEGVNPNIPPFLTTPKFTPSQMAETKRKREFSWKERFGELN